MQTDASLIGEGIILAQKFDDDEHPILFLSKKFTQAERNYSTIERELAAIIYGVKKLKHYLDGTYFELHTDHNPLIYLKKRWDLMRD